MGCSDAQCEAIRWGALLHDIGKLGVPEAILRKPGPLTDDEWAIMHQHPDIGAHILEQVPWLAPAVPIVRYHQERWDGTGYPHGLAGHTIPLEARILAVADAFAAMTDERLYRQALSPEQALEELRKGAGSQFDPQVVEALIQLVSTSPA
jgi:HD-GYP domain-containing protein (c-di-GMP phosphodiesterase class II)